MPGLHPERDIELQTWSRTVFGFGQYRKTRTYASVFQHEAHYRKWTLDLGVCLLICVLVILVSQLAKQTSCEFFMLGLGRRSHQQVAFRVCWLFVARHGQDDIGLGGGMALRHSVCAGTRHLELGTPAMTRRCGWTSWRSFSPSSHSSVATPSTKAQRMSASVCTSTPSIGSMVEHDFPGS